MTCKNGKCSVFNLTEESDIDESYNERPEWAWLKENFIIPLKQKDPYHIINESNNARWSYWALRGHYGIDPPHNYWLVE